MNKIATWRIRAKAARWVTELHGPEHNTELETEVQRWIAKDPRHAAAFDRAIKTWKLYGNLPGHLPERTSGSMLGRFRPATSLQTLAGMITLGMVLIGTIYLLRDNTLSTGPAQQRTVELSDGTQASLNANSRVVVQYDDHVRKVTLIRGEVLFNVVKHQSRPFVVVIGERKIIAMGTSFVVRREEPAGPAFAVTLMEGRVAIEPISWPNALPSTPFDGVKFLSPGERLRFTGDAAETVDSPSIEKITAWHRGQLIFDDTSLSEAVAEFNRYGLKEIVIDDPAVAKLRIGGVFGIGDADSFTQDMAKTFHLRAVTRGNTIVLTNRHRESR